MNKVCPNVMSELASLNWLKKAVYTGQRGGLHTLVQILVGSNQAINKNYEFHEYCCTYKMLKKRINYAHVCIVCACIFHQLYTTLPQICTFYILLLYMERHARL
jgi:hypothetical protein